MYHRIVSENLSIPMTSITIAIMSEDSISRTYVADLLRTHGICVESFLDGKSMLDRISNGGIDLVVLDALISGLIGIDYCQLIKNLSVDDFIPVIVLTNKNDPDSRIEGLRIGADDYIATPLNELELLSRISNLLRIKKMHDEVSLARARLEKISFMDELTGIYNFRYLHSRLSEEFKRAERFQDPLACALIDIDHFTKVNEQFGETVGNNILSEIAKRLQDTVREIDVVARYDGDEFLLVLPSTHFGGSLTVADRICRTISEKPFVCGNQELTITVSLGLALYPSRDVITKNELVKAATHALLQAKHDGRNRIYVYQHQGYFYQPQSEN